MQAALAPSPLPGCAGQGGLPGVLLPSDPWSSQQEAGLARHGGQPPVPGTHRQHPLNAGPVRGECPFGDTGLELLGSRGEWGRDRKSREQETPPPVCWPRASRGDNKAHPSGPRDHGCSAHQRPSEPGDLGLERGQDERRSAQPGTEPRPRFQRPRGPRPRRRHVPVHARAFEHLKTANVRKPEDFILKKKIK